MKNLLQLNYELKLLHAFMYNDKHKKAVNTKEIKSFIKSSLGINYFMAKYNQRKEVRRANKLLKLRKSLTFDEYP